MAKVNQFYESIKNNPELFQIGGQLTDLLAGDQNIYGKNREMQDLGKIGSTAVGQGLSKAGDAAMATGNPYAMLGGLAAKGIGGAIDVGKYLFGKQKFNVDQDAYKGDNFGYDLGDELIEAASIDPKKTGREAFKKTAVLGLLPGLIAAPFARKKAKKLKREANKKIREAQGKFNEANMDRARRQSVRESFMPTTRPALFGSGYSDIMGMF